LTSVSATIHNFTIVLPLGPIPDGRGRCWWPMQPLSNTGSLEAVSRDTTPAPQLVQRLVLTVRKALALASSSGSLSKLVLGGFGQGAFLACHGVAALRAEGVVADALVIISGFLDVGVLRKAADTLPDAAMAPIHVFAAHGEDDQVLPELLVHKSISALRELTDVTVCDISLEMFFHEEEHIVGEGTVEAIIKWLESIMMPSSSSPPAEEDPFADRCLPQHGSGGFSGRAGNGFASAHTRPEPHADAWQAQNGSGLIPGHGGNGHATSPYAPVEDPQPRRVPRGDSRRGRAKEPTCPNGHSLNEFFTPEDGWTCSVCSAAVTQDSSLMRCRICDYRVCRRCRKQNPQWRQYWKDLCDEDYNLQFCDEEQQQEDLGGPVEAAQPPPTDAAPTDAAPTPKWAKGMAQRAAPRAADDPGGDDEGKFVEGDAVKIKGLQSATNLNGARAVLEVWDSTSGRWEVEVQSTSQRVNVKPVNLERFISEPERRRKALMARVNSPRQLAALRSASINPIFDSPQMQQLIWGVPATLDSAAIPVGAKLATIGGSTCIIFRKELAGHDVAPPTVLLFTGRCDGDVLKEVVPLASAYQTSLGACVVVPVDPPKTSEVLGKTRSLVTALPSSVRMGSLAVHGSYTGSIPAVQVAAERSQHDSAVPLCRLLVLENGVLSADMIPKLSGLIGSIGNDPLGLAVKLKLIRCPIALVRGGADEIAFTKRDPVDMVAAACPHPPLILRDVSCVDDGGRELIPELRRAARQALRPK